MTKIELAQAVETELHAGNVLLRSDHFKVAARVRRYSKALLEYQYDMAVLARDSRGIKVWQPTA